MSSTYITHNSIISSLGFSSKTVVSNIQNGISGLKQHNLPQLLPETFCASLVNNEKLNDHFIKISSAVTNYTKLEKMMLLSLQQIMQESNIELTKRVGLIISTTKGNIDALDTNNHFPEQRAYLTELGKRIKDFFSFQNQPIILSNACVSGLLAIAVAKRFIQQNLYDHVFIVSGDLVSKFVLSGFNSFQALSKNACKPFDLNRNGVNLGEMAAAALVTNNRNNLPPEAVTILGEGSCNDANHISGPSRTGEGLYQSMQSAFLQANLTPEKIDYVSAHGTATPYNDEMEAVAFTRMQLNQTPLNSLKGYFGHTLGASGLVETIIGMHSLKNNLLYKSLGFKNLGVSKPINIITNNKKTPLHIFLKTASGFGGCNTAVLFKKTNQ